MFLLRLVDLFRRTLRLTPPRRFPNQAVKRHRLCGARPFRKRQTPVDLSNRIHVALAVFDNLGDFSGAVVGVDFRAVEMFFGRGDAERFRKQVEAGVFAAPFAPLLHGVVDRGVAEAGKRNVARWFDLVDDRTLIDKAHVEVQNIVADEEIAIDGEFPEVFDDVGFFSHAIKISE